MVNLRPMSGKGWQYISRKKPSSHLPTERASVQKPTDNLQSKGELFGVQRSLPVIGSCNSNCPLDRPVPINLNYCITALLHYLLKYLIFHFPRTIAPLNWISGASAAKDGNLDRSEPNRRNFSTHSLARPSRRKYRVRATRWSLGRCHKSQPLFEA